MKRFIIFSLISLACAAGLFLLLTSRSFRVEVLGGRLPSHYIVAYDLYRFDHPSWNLPELHSLLNYSCRKRPVTGSYEILNPHGTIQILNSSFFPYSKFVQISTIETIECKNDGTGSLMQIIPSGSLRLRLTRAKGEFPDIDVIDGTGAIQISAGKLNFIQDSGDILVIKALKSSSIGLNKEAGKPVRLLITSGQVELSVKAGERKALSRAKGKLAFISVAASADLLVPGANIKLTPNERNLVVDAAGFYLEK